MALSSPRITATHLDGPKLADWLEREGLITEDFTPEYLSKSQRDAFCRWKNGRAAELGYVDRLITELHRHIEELPDEVFLDHRPNERPGIARRIVRLRDLGWNFNEIAAMVGVTSDTVSRHARKATA
jgi:DNA-directed RNA polymerase specialized sigma24 family protein